MASDQPLGRARARLGDYLLPPLISKDVKMYLRKKRAAFLQLLFLAGCFGTAWMLWPQEGIYSLSANSAHHLFTVLGIGQLAMVVLFAPAFTSPAFTMEKERNTFDLLYGTRMSPFAIVWGKTAGALTFLLLVILSSVPVVSICLVLGGVDRGDVLWFYVILFLTALQFGMIGLTVSLWVRPAEVPNAAPFGVLDATGIANLYLALNTNVRVLKWNVAAGTLVGNTFLYDLDEWQLVSLVLDNGSARVHCNALSSLSLGAYTDFLPPLRPLIGNRNGSSDFFDGRIDEVRVSRVARSADWLAAAYATVASNGTFCSYGPVETGLDPLDEDHDGLPDDWELLYLGNTNSSGTAYSDIDRACDGDEYLAGTDPTDPTSVFALRVVWSNGQPVVRFMAVEAAGVGYEGRTRFYDLESTTNLVLGPWLGVPGVSNVLGANQVVESVGPTNTASAILYRARTRLLPE